MSNTVKPDVLELVDALDLAQLHEETLINAFICCEALDGGSSIDRAAFLAIVKEKQTESRTKAKALWGAIKGALS